MRRGRWKRPTRLDKHTFLPRTMGQCLRDQKLPQSTTPNPALHVTAAPAGAAGLTMGNVARGRGVTTSHERRGSAWARAPPAGRQGRFVPARQGRPGPALLLQRSDSTSSLPFPRYTVTARKKKKPTKENIPHPLSWPRNFLSLLAFYPLLYIRILFLSSTV